MPDRSQILTHRYNISSPVYWPIRLMLYREAVAVRCETCTEYINIHCKQIAVSLVQQQVVYTASICFQNTVFGGSLFAHVSSLLCSLSLNLKYDDWIQNFTCFNIRQAEHTDISHAVGEYDRTFQCSWSRDSRCMSRKSRAEAVRPGGPFRKLVLLGS